MNTLLYQMLSVTAVLVISSSFIVDLLLGTTRDTVSGMVAIGIIGAGAVGLASAINAQQAFPNAKVTIVADKFTKDTTSYGASGLFRVVPNPEHSNYEIIRQCALDSWDFLKETANSQFAREAGICKIHCTAVYNTPQDKSYAFLREVAPDFRVLSRQELHKQGSNYKYGYAFTSFIVQCPYYLDWLMKKFLDNGGQVQSRKVNKLSELRGEFDLIINCSGLGAEQLTSDKEIGPVKGQLVYLRAPWVKQASFADGIVHVVPQVDRVVVGTIREKGSYDLRVDPEVSLKMLAKAENLVPELKGAEVIGTWTGLRPARDSIRLEIEHLDCGSRFVLPIIHNYGHGAHGIALSWGTSLYAATLARQALDGLTSKL